MNDVVMRGGARSLLDTRYDLLAFAVAFLGGVALFVLLHFGLHAPQWVVSGTIAVVMVAYAASVAFVPRLRVRLDQAGDNGYYLGLLFTLFSMAVALWEFGSAIDTTGTGSSGARQIIANFGVALTSTIVGIFIRVLLNQMRVDPADVESMTRIELSEASREVKSKLSQVSINMGMFHTEIQQRTGDVVHALLKDVGDTLEKFTREVTSATERLLGDAAKAQEQVGRQTTEVMASLHRMIGETEEAITRLAAVEAPPTRLATRLDKVTGSLESLGGTLTGIEQSVGPTRDALQSTAASLTEAAQALAAASAQSRAAEAATLAQIARTTQEFAASLRGVGDALGTDRALVQASQQATVETLENLSTATERLTGLIRTPARASAET